jgi:hypothetical protein
VERLNDGSASISNRAWAVQPAQALIEDFPDRGRTVLLSCKNGPVPFQAEMFNLTPKPSAAMPEARAACAD